MNVIILELSSPCNDISKPRSVVRLGGGEVSGFQGERGGEPDQQCPGVLTPPIGAEE